MQTIQEKIKNLPGAPGVYFFYAKDKELLYIGKATNLRSRVQSYFRGVIPGLIRNPQQILKQVQDDIINVQGRSEWIGRMVAQVSDIAFQETDSVLEALILESNLIKKHQPKYNTLAKDDKSFAYFVVTKEEFPRILIIRKTDLDKMPKTKLKISNKVQKSNDKSSVKSFKYKDITVGKSFGPYSSKMQMQTALKIIRRIFPFHSLKQKSEKGCLDFQLGVCPGPHNGSISRDDYKKNIRGIKMILEGKKGSLIRMLKKEMESSAKKQEFEKAADLRNKIYALEHIRDVALMTREFDSQELVISNQSLVKGELVASYELPVAKFRIEAYDISNISGDHAVGSMVVFENGKPNKSQYRKFKIKTVEGSNDVGMMKEVLTRRFQNDWAMPDLVLLDGGLGHLNMGEKLLHEELGLDIALAGVAKGPTRKKLDVRIAKNTKYKIQDTLQIDSQIFYKKINDVLQNDLLLKFIMDEAHRFAITFHRRRRSKNLLN